MKELSISQKVESGAARGLLALPAAMLRIIAGRPVVRDGLTLDVQCQLLLRIMKLRGVTLGGGEVAAQRRQMDAQSRTLEPRTEYTVQTSKVRLAGGDGAVAARRYVPEHCASPAPALLFYHGGGFVVGSLDSHDGICRALAERAQCVVFSVDYRMAPEHAAPAAADDATASYRDVIKRAEELDIDPARVAVAGDSAGGNLAAVTALQTRHDQQPPCYQMLFYPVVDFGEDAPSKDIFATGFLLEKASMDWFEDHYLPDGFDKCDPRVSPLYDDPAGVAPAVVLTGGFDPLRDEGEAYADKLKKAGVTVSQRRESSLIHGFLNFAGGVERANEALNDAAHDLRLIFANG